MVLLKITSKLFAFRSFKTFDSSNIIKLSSSIGPSMPVAERITPTTMKLDTANFHSLFTPELRQLHNYFENNNFQLRLAGGAVRDLLMNIKPSDVDFATDATPQQMKEMFTRQNVRIFNKNGENHGTVSCRINDKQNFEITTLRIDVVCDGRRAKVEFTTDWQLDANRRDLTINSLFLDMDGTVIDYFGGIRDIQERRVAFVGNTQERIQEDYLRILRYFRFFGRVVESGTLHEEDTLNAIIENKNNLKEISGERVWTELRKICIGSHGDEVIAIMLDRCNMSTLLGLPANSAKQLVEFERVYKGNMHRSIQPITLISTLFSSKEDIQAFHSRCRLSNAERHLSLYILVNRDKLLISERSLKDLQNFLLDASGPGSDKTVPDARTRVLELAKYADITEAVLKEFIEWKMPIFPISGNDLLSFMRAGPVMFEVLSALYEVWMKHNQQVSKEELLKCLTPEFIEECSIKSRNRKRKLSKEML